MRRLSKSLNTVIHFSKKTILAGLILSYQTDAPDHSILGNSVFNALKIRCVVKYSAVVKDKYSMYLNHVTYLRTTKFPM